MIKPGKDSTTDTADRLLDAAEALYAESGLEAISVRSITARAHANLAAIGYHFGSKDALIQAVIQRRYNWLNNARRDKLDGLEADAAAGRPQLEDVIDVLLLPVLNPFPDRPSESARFRQFFSRVFSESPDFQKSIQIKGFRRTTERVVELLRKILPHLSDREIYWRLHFSAGPLVGTLTHGNRLRVLSNGRCDPDDIEEAVRQLRGFICAGLRAPSFSTTDSLRQPA
jgi:AcrR family transcriptional regulator